MPEQRKRSYKLGHRTDKDVAKDLGKMSRSRWAWVKVYFGQFVIWADYASEQSDEVLDVKILYPIPNRPAISWNLTALTEEELLAVKEIFNVAFDHALPICQQRDKEAADAFAAGDDSHSRIYRQVPQLVYRPGTELQHGEGVQHRSSDAAGALQPDGDSGDGVRGQGSAVAERDEGDGSAEDHGSSAD